ncbi:maleylpyruvate isomerase family mycothiol-dependent enzyme [Streptomyces sp. NPDC093225]|uniref:maleylpyruvate isomerase family mycothiol-dependent enzyme n=1 Tax=Streptomyces sp. NPDC093225 TaxID=3366034 RepID=UPI00382CD74E
MEDTAGLQAEVAAAAERFAAAAAGLTDADVPAPVRLPGWTRGHVVAHVAAAADAYVRLLRGARGVAAPGPAPESDRGPAGAVGAPAAELAAHVRRALDGFGREARAMPQRAWAVPVTALAGYRHPAWFLLRRCQRELETHLVDLDVGYGTADWPAGYVGWALDGTVAALRARGFAVRAVAATDLGRRWELTPGGSPGPVVTGRGHALLGWLSGRAGTDGLVVEPAGGVPPVPPPWPQAPVPGWG